MSIKKEVTQALVSGANIENFFDKKFIKILKEDLGDINIEHFCTFVSIKDKKGIENKERIVIANSENKNKFVVDAKKPETFKKLIKAIEKYLDR